MEAIQLLKRFNNDLSKFIGEVVVYNPRYERVEFNNLHRHLLEMGQLSSRQLKEGLDVLKQVSFRGKFAKVGGRR